MASDLVRQWYRRRFVRRCAAVVDEFRAHGSRIHRQRREPRPRLHASHRRGAHRHAVAVEPEDVAGTAGEFRLLFLGRLVTLKGGDLLLASLPAVREAWAGRFASRSPATEPARDAWEEQAKKVQSEVDG